MKLSDYGLVKLTREEKAAAWDWLRHVAEENHHATVACIEWTRLIRREQRSELHQREWLRYMVLGAVLALSVWGAIIFFFGQHN